MTRIHYCLPQHFLLGVVALFAGALFAQTPQKKAPVKKKAVFLDCSSGAPLRFKGIFVKRGSDNRLVRIDVCGAAEDELYYLNPADDNADTDVPVIIEPPFLDGK